MKSTKLISAVIGLSALFSASAIAADHPIKVNVTNFDPMVIKIAPGDTVSWAKMTGHITETINEYLPEGAEGWISKMGEDFRTPPLTVEGIYPYKCTPHWGAGMGGVIIVGEPTNLEAVKALKPKGAAKRLIKKTEKALK